MLRATEPEVFTGLVGEVLAFEEREEFGGSRCRWSSPSERAITSRHRSMHAGWSRIRERTLVEYEGAGHMLMYERRAEISDCSTSSRRGFL